MKKTAVFRVSGVKAGPPADDRETYVEETDGSTRYVSCGCRVGECTCSSASSKPARPAASTAPRQLALPAPPPDLGEAIKGRRGHKGSSERRAAAASQAPRREASRRSVVAKFLRSRLSPPTEAPKSEPRIRRAASEERPDPPPDIKQAIARARGAA